MHPVPSTDDVLHIVLSEQVEPPFPPHVLVLTEPSGRKTSFERKRYFPSTTVRGGPFMSFFPGLFCFSTATGDLGGHAACFLLVGLLLLLARSSVVVARLSRAQETF